MYQALNCFNVLGVKTNIDFLKQILVSTEFIMGNIDTQLLSNRDYINHIKTNLTNASKEFKGGLTSEEVGVIATALFQRLKMSANHHSVNNKILKCDKQKNYWKALEWK
jgi:pyruvate carboxylase